MQDPATYRIRISAAIRRGEQMLIVRESRYGEERINLPGGLPQFGETLEQALIREVCARKPGSTSSPPESRSCWRTSPSAGIKRALRSASTPKSSEAPRCRTARVKSKAANGEPSAIPARQKAVMRSDHAMYQRNDERATPERQRLSRLETIAKRLQDESAESHARHLAQQVEQGVLNVLVVGQFKRGKSSLVNALIGAHIMPVGVLPVTGSVTSVRYAPRPEGRVSFHDGRSEEIRVEELSRYVSEQENPGNRLGVSHVRIGWPSSLLENIALFDTPGTGSTYEWNTSQAREALPHADASILVVGPEPPIGNEELGFAKEVAGSTQRLFVVLNKADLAGDRLSEIIAFTRAALREAIGRDVELYTAVAAPQSDDPGYRRFLRDFHHFIATSRMQTLQASIRRRTAALAERLLLLSQMRLQALLLPREQRLQKMAAVHRAINALDDRVRSLRLLVDDDVRRLCTQLEALMTRLREEAELQIPGLAESIAAERSVDQRIERIETLVSERAARWREKALSSASETIRQHTEVYARQLAELESAMLAAGTEALGIARRVPLPPPLRFAPANLSIVTSSIPTTGLEIAIEHLIGILPPVLRTNAVRSRAARILESEFDALVGKMRYGIGRDLEPWRRSLNQTISTTLEDARRAVLSAFESGDSQPDDAAIEELRRIEHELKEVRAAGASS
jgi:hypothetical protein